MRVNILILGAALASATAVVTLQRWIDSRTERTNAILLLVAEPRTEHPPDTLDLEGTNLSTHPESTRVPAPPIEDLEERSIAEGANQAFDLTFVTVDSVGRPVPWTCVELALDGFRFNRVGTSDMKGRLHVKWTGASACFDGLVRCGGPTLGSRLRLRGGAPVTVRIRADETIGETYDPAQSMTDRMSVGSDLARHGLRFASVPSFRLDAEGQGELVDANLIARIPLPGNKSGGGWGGGCAGCGFSTRHDLHIEGTVHDEHGKPLRGVEYRVIRRKGTTLSGETNWEGRIVLDVDGSGCADVWIGGRDRALVCKTLDEDDSQAAWDVELPKVPLASGILVDESGARLRDWMVEAHDSERNFVGATVTNGAGEFEIGVPDGGTVELRARSRPTMPACLVARRFVPGREPTTVVATARIATISWWIELPFEVEGEAPEARLQRLDTGECVTVALSEVEERADGPARFRFRSDELIAGDYVLSSFAPGCSPAGARGVLAVLAEQDFGKIALANVLDVEIPPAGGQGLGASWVTVVKLVRGMRVISQPMLLPGKFAMTEGDYELQYRRLPGRGTPELVRPFRVGKGETRFSWCLGDTPEPAGPPSLARER